LGILGILGILGKPDNTRVYMQSAACNSESNAFFLE